MPRPRSVVCIRGMAEGDLDLFEGSVALVGQSGEGAPQIMGCDLGLDVATVMADGLKQISVSWVAEPVCRAAFPASRLKARPDIFRYW